MFSRMKCSVSKREKLIFKNILKSDFLTFDKGTVTSVFLSNPVSRFKQQSLPLARHKEESHGNFDLFIEECKLCCNSTCDRIVQIRYIVELSRKSNG